MTDTTGADEARRLAAGIDEALAQPTLCAAFQVTAAGAAPLAYQWFRNDTALADGGNISGAASATVTVANIAAGDVGRYHVQVRNSAGQSVTSAAAPHAAPTCG